MCGISAVVWRAEPGDGRVIEAMAAATAHRGPDGTRVWTSDDARVALGMNTLCIVGSRDNCGPYVTDDGAYALTFNGEIFNYRELALRWGIPLTARDTDATFLLSAFRLRGPAVFAELDGMFGLAVFDREADRVLVARDRLGEKTVHHRLDESGFYLSSEIRGLSAAVTLQKTVRRDWLAVETLVEDATPYQGVTTVPAGSFLTLDLSAMTVEQTVFWDLADPATHADVEDRPRPLLAGSIASAVSSRVSDLPSSLLLSGGLDSAVLALSLQPQLLVTVQYDDDPQLDELDNAQRVADAIDRELVVVRPTAAQFCDRALELVRRLEYPLGNSSPFNEMLAYEQVASAGIRVVFGGLGPDELLLGYARHSIALGSADTSPDADLATYGPMRDAFENDMESRRAAAERYLAILLRDDDRDARSRLAVYASFARATDLGKGLTLADLAVPFPAQVISSDKLSSSFGLERRSPYLARGLTERAYDLELHEKTGHELGTKGALRCYARQLGVPEAVWADQNKKGFSSPVPRWLNGELEGWFFETVGACLDAHDVPEGLRHYLIAARSRVHDRYDRRRLHAVLLALWWMDDPPGGAWPRVIPAGHEALGDPGR